MRKPHHLGPGLTEVQVQCSVWMGKDNLVPSAFHYWLYWFTFPECGIYPFIIILYNLLVVKKYIYRIGKKYHQYLYNLGIKEISNPLAAVSHPPSHQLLAH